MVTIPNPAEQSKDKESQISDEVKKESRVLSYAIGIALAVIVYGVLLFGIYAFFITGDKPNRSEFKRGQISLIASPVLVKKVSNSAFGLPIEIMRIGTVLQGEFEGKMLALAFQRNPDESELKKTMYPYAYFISENNGDALAWDKEYIHELTSSNTNENSNINLKTVLNFIEGKEKDLSFLPAEFSLQRIIEMKNGKDIFRVSVDSLEYKVGNGIAIEGAVTKAGSQVMKIVDTEPEVGKILPTTTYYLLLPFGMSLHIVPEADFIQSNNTIPSLTWTAGDKTVGSYRYGEYAAGWDDCLAGISIEEFYNSLVITGKTSKGDPLYEVNTELHPEVYECLQVKINDTAVSSLYFAQTHPMFFWKHATGDYVVFLKGVK